MREPSPGSHIFFSKRSEPSYGSNKTVIKSSKLSAGSRLLCIESSEPRAGLLLLMSKATDSLTKSSEPALGLRIFYREETQFQFE